MATHSSILAWEIPWTEEPGGLQSMGSQRVRHDLATKQQQSVFMMPLSQFVPLSAFPLCTPLFSIPALYHSCSSVSFF